MGGSTRDTIYFDIGHEDPLTEYLMFEDMMQETMALFFSSYSAEEIDIDNVISRVG